ncbi:vacuolar iron transporter 1-like [Hordeum vulgare subsp. vulgare]|uniref:Vacuolar iron transporter n=1 Tax=Hordeum vulgare subsp. vulgare TaxID=112509 RepID=A0A8I7BF82_HORVV|nr:vacuolar iron transporter 1-like [Hordeum vulgare subsp. vulgare]
MAGAGEGREQPTMLEKELISSHKEHHFTAGEVVRDVIMGVSDGLTVPFALAAGLSGASAPSSLVLTTGLAEVAAGAISMELGGYLAAKSEADHYERELSREQEEIITVPDIEAAEIGEIMSNYGLEPHEYGPMVTGLRRKPQAWLEFMMRFELGLEKPDPRRALQSALTIALSYVVGGLVPLMPYMLISTAYDAMLTSVVATLVALFFFGYVKGRFTGSRPLFSALQTTFIGAAASAAAYGIAKAVQA